MTATSLIFNPQPFGSLTHESTAAAINCTSIGPKNRAAAAGGQTTNTTASTSARTAAGTARAQRELSTSTVITITNTITISTTSRHGNGGNNSRYHHHSSDRRRGSQQQSVQPSYDGSPTPSQQPAITESHQRSERYTSRPVTGNSEEVPVQVEALRSILGTKIR
ncbi:hypothetical protein G7Y79_00005g017590 [Physcia stellaris]|nr:hypothetical protein G7Y79_00005g017590 [Physcia stellaris]